MLQTSLRVRCRNQRCRSKLPIPTDNDHKAFCSRFCYDQFYHLKCVVCEKPVAKRPRGKTPKWCIRRQCRLDYNRYREAFEFKPHSHCQNSGLTQEVPVSQGAKGLSGAPEDIYRGGIKGPRSAVEAHITHAHNWDPVISSDGVRSFQTTIRRPALVRAA